MPLPPKGDPRRPMHLAIRSCQGLGLLFMLFGTLFGVSMALSHRRVHWVGLAVVILLVITPGVLYVMTAIFMRRRQEWAVILGLIISSVQGLFALLAFVGSLVNGELVPVFITLLWVLAMGQLIYQLSKSPAAMRADTQFQPRGFEVIPMAMRVDDDKSSDT